MIAIARSGRRAVKNRRSGKSHRFLTEIFTYNTQPYFIAKVQNKKVLARRVLKDGTPGKLLKEFSRSMVERSVGHKLPDGSYSLRQAA